MKLDLDKIEEVEIDLTTMCNASCPLCFRNHEECPEKYLHPFERSSPEILNQLLTFKNLKKVDLIGQLSEPTTHSQFIFIVKDLKQLGKQLKICSNGSLYDESFWEYLGNVLDNEDRVWFTLCGSTQEIHSIYRTGTSLSQILRNASALRRSRKIDGVRALVFKYNQEDLQSKRFREIADQFSFQETITSSIIDRNSRFREKVDIDLLSPPLKTSKEYYILDGFSRVCKMQIDCQSMIENKIQIDPFGNIYPCYLFLESSLGDGWDQDYSRILEGKNECCRFCKRQASELRNKMNLGSVI